MASTSDNDTVLLERIQQRVLWLAAQQIHYANHLRRPAGALKVGGHQDAGMGSAYVIGPTMPGKERVLARRFRGVLIEDDSYFWAVSRYLHLNPVRGKRPLVVHPRDWQWSSYRGYVVKQIVLSGWLMIACFVRGKVKMGGFHPERSYRRFVEAGIDDPPANPLRAAWEGWVLGSKAFLKRIKRRMSRLRQRDQVPRARRFLSLDAEEVVAAVAKYYEVDTAAYAARRSTATGRDLAAYMAHCRTTATLRERAALFGLGHPDSVSNLIRRAEKAIAQSAALNKNLEQIEKSL